MPRTGIDSVTVASSGIMQEQTDLRLHDAARLFNDPARDADTRCAVCLKRPDAPILEIIGGAVSRELFVCSICLVSALQTMQRGIHNHRHGSKGKV